MTLSDFADAGRAAALGNGESRDWRQQLIHRMYTAAVGFGDDVNGVTPDAWLRVAVTSPLFKELSNSKATRWSHRRRSSEGMMEL